MKIFGTLIVLGVAISVSSGQEPWGGLGAVAVINVGKVGLIAGSLELRQSGPESPVIITGEITGLEPNSVHGFHIHNSGDVRKGCGSTGGHFNPHVVNHGGPTDDIRHAGDLGNIQADAYGNVRVAISDYRITLCGPNSVIGRAFVIHSGMDDFGRGGAPDSLTTGNAGSRIGCGIIGIL